MAKQLPHFGTKRALSGEGLTLQVPQGQFTWQLTEQRNLGFVTVGELSGSCIVQHSTVTVPH